MNTCPVCQLIYSEETEPCPRDGARLAAKARDERECAYCAELILKKARVRKRCGRDVEPLVTASNAAQAPPPAAPQRIVEAPTVKPQVGKAEPAKADTTVQIAPPASPERIILWLEK
jgi:hypothetical protein